MHVSYDIRIKVQQVTEMANSVEHVDFNSNNRRRSRNFLGSKGGFYFMGVAGVLTIFWIFKRGGGVLNPLSIRDTKSSDEHLLFDEFQ